MPDTTSSDETPNPGGDAELLPPDGSLRINISDTVIDVTEIVVDDPIS